MSIESGPAKSGPGEPTRATVRAGEQPIPQVFPVPDVDMSGFAVVSSRRLTVFLVLGYFGIWLAFFSPIILTIPLRIGQLAPDNKAGVLSLVLGLSALFGLAAAPVAGRLSDRCTSRFGRRRPYLIGSLLVGLIGLGIEAISANIPLFTAGACVAAAGFSASISVILALLPEHIPPSRRGAVSGFLGVAQAVGTGAGIGIGSAISVHSIGAAFVVPGVLGFLAILGLCLVFADRPQAKNDLPPISVRELVQSFHLNPRQHPNFSWAWLSRFTLFMAIGGITSYQVFYLTDQLHLSDDTAAKYVGIGTGLQAAAIIASSAISGLLSDRLHRRRAFVVGAAFVAAVAMALLAITTSVPVFFVGLVLIGVAEGIYFAVDLALVSEILPHGKLDMGRDFGIFSLANQLPQAAAPAIAPIFLAIGIGSVSSTGDNYTSLFLASALFAVVSGITILKVRGVR